MVVTCQNPTFAALFIFPAVVLSLILLGGTNDLGDERISWVRTTITSDGQRGIAWEYIKIIR
jgi:hypothetical protein